jgi:antitoxin CptB
MPSDGAGNGGRRIALCTAGDDRSTMAASRDDLDIRRRRIKIRAWRRGMREMDILIGGFVDAELDLLDEADLADLEALLDAPDDEVFRWLTGAEPVSAAFDTAVFRRIAAFHTHERPLDL